MFGFLYARISRRAEAVSKVMCLRENTEKDATKKSLF